MKVGIAAAKTPEWPKIDWLQEATERLGHEVRRATDQTQLLPLVEECDVVILGHRSTAGRWPNIGSKLERRRCPVVYWWFDLVATNAGLPIDAQPLFQRYAETFRAADVVLVKERDLLDEYHSLGVNAFWCDQGCPADYPAIHPVGDSRWDLLLWGQVGHYNERAEAAVAAASAGYSVAWATTQHVPRGIERLPWTRPEELPSLASQARCVLSCGVRNDLAGYWSDGFWMALGMGACVIRRATPGLPDGPFHIYHDTDQLIDCLSWVKSNRDEAKQLGAKAREWVMQHHTIERRIEQVLKLVSQERTRSARIAAEQGFSKP